MGKNHHHKKVLKAEKAKVKLRQSKTKFLPKGLNVTDTSFKIKPIVIPEQLKERAVEDALSKRKLNVKDLLTRIKHYNENVRSYACMELTEVIKIYTKEIVQKYLQQICLTLSNLMQDKEKKVRKAAIKCISTISRSIPRTKLAPFFNYFSTNLRCAMTNIDKNIQEDSLLFLDCFIVNDCGLISKTSEKLLPDFLSLISKLKNESQPGRTLTLNLGSKITSVAWRIRVLSRLHAVLNIVLKQEGCKENVSRYSIADALQSSTFGVYKDKFGENLENPTLDFFSLTTKISGENTKVNVLNKHIISLIPLLHETWLEVMPDETFKKSGSETITINEETAILLKCITSTLYLLWKYVKQISNEEINLHTVFMSKEGKKFLKYLLKNFPYTLSSSRPKRIKENNLKILDYNNDPECIHENLLICFMYSILHVNCAHPILKNDLGIMVSYITKLLFQKKALGEENISCLIEFLKECFGKKYQTWLKCGLDLQLMLENIIRFYQCGKMTTRTKLELFGILSNLVDNGYFYKLEHYQNWLSTLPDILCETQLTDTIIFELLQLSKKNCNTFHAALIKKLPLIIENLSKLQIVITSDSLLQNEQSAKRNLANIFYYIPNRTDLKIIQNFVTNKDHCEYKQYFRNMLYLRENSG